MSKLQAQEQATANKAIKKVPVPMYQKTVAPQTFDQSEGGKVCGPDWTYKSHYEERIVGLIKNISSQQISAEIKIKFM